MLAQAEPWPAGAAGPGASAQGPARWARARPISGIVHLEGAIAGGTNPQAFTLPAGFRPAHNVYVSVDANGANRGHVLITPSGQVNVFGEEDSQSAVTSLTSLDGVSFAP